MRARIGRRGVIAARALGAGLAALALAGAAAQSNDAVGSGRPLNGQVYSGKPDLQTTAALIRAGGGARGFTTTALVSEIAGARANAEGTRLVQMFGAADVKQFIRMCDFTVHDALRNSVELRKATAADPSIGGTQLAAALVSAGRDRATIYDFNHMLDRLLSHALEVKIKADIKAEFGVQAELAYRRVAAQLSRDLRPDMQ